MTITLSLEIALDDMVLLPGRYPMKVIELNHFTGEITVWDNVNNCDLTIDLYQIIAGVLTVERTQRYVISPS